MELIYDIIHQIGLTLQQLLINIYFKKYDFH